MNTSAIRSILYRDIKVVPIKNTAKPDNMIIAICRRILLFQWSINELYNLFPPLNMSIKKFKRKASTKLKRIMNQPKNPCKNR